MAQKVPLREVLKQYDRYRRRYFAEFSLPPSCEIEWEWMDDTGDLGATLPPFDSDDVFTIRLNRILRHIPRLLWLTLLHEMCHVANPRANHGPWFKRQADRLASLGAMREFFSW